VPRPCPVLRPWARVGTRRGPSRWFITRTGGKSCWTCKTRNLLESRVFECRIWRAGSCRSWPVRKDCCSLLVCRWALHRTESGKETSVVVRLQTPEVVGTCGREFSVGAAVVTWRRRVDFQDTDGIRYRGSRRRRCRRSEIALGFFFQHNWN
jgi:hypothetical protein